MAIYRQKKDITENRMKGGYHMITENDEIKAYKERIIEMIQKCDNLDWLKFTFAFLRKLLE